jgi:hypothetical protein
MQAAAQRLRPSQLVHLQADGVIMHDMAYAIQSVAHRHTLP